jgi:undecaprenyl-diphosphatase
MSITEFDRSLFSAINSFHASWADSIMYFISSKYAAIPLYLFVLIILIKQFGKQVGWILLAIALLTLVSDQTSVAVKNSVERYRPCHNEDLKSTVHLVDNKCGGKFGFYSSHASNIMALAVLLSSLITSPFLRTFLFVWVFVVGYSRIYLGAHYPLDVVIGWLVGAAFALAFSAILKNGPLKKHYNSCKV